MAILLPFSFIHVIRLTKWHIFFVSVCECILLLHSYEASVLNELSFFYDPDFKAKPDWKKTERKSIAHTLNFVKITSEKFFLVFLWPPEQLKQSFCSEFFFSLVVIVASFVCLANGCIYVCDVWNERIKHEKNRTKNPAVGRIMRSH